MTDVGLFFESQCRCTTLYISNEFQKFSLTILSKIEENAAIIGISSHWLEDLSADYLPES